MARAGSEELFLVEDGRRVSLGPPTSELLRALKLLRHGDIEVGDHELAARLGPFAEDVPRLLASGWLATGVLADDAILAEVRTFGSAAKQNIDLGLDFERPMALSRFALIRRDGDAMVLESAITASWARVSGREAGSWLFELGYPSDLSASADGSEPRDVFIRALSAVGFLVNLPGPEDETLRLGQWSAHEALFHGRSRWGALNGTMPVGPSSWAAGVFEVPPARRTSTRPVIALDRPGADRAPHDDGPSFFDVLDRRKSERFHNADEPLDLPRLAEFLFRTARVRSSFTYEGIEYIDRPYPSGGGAHEFELYIAARHVAGLDPGLYRYDSFEHALEVVSASPDVAVAFAASASRATTLAVPPQAVIVVAARFGRLLARYRAMGYATVLKNVGVLYQTMYLVATALGLAPCALGNGDVDLFAAATGADPWEEASVGEFSLGSLPKD